MILCTECYIQQDGKTLMLYRNKKKNDINQGKWIGLGGKFEFGESPEECLIREVREEAGVTVMDYKLRGILTFKMMEKPKEPLYIFVFTASAYEGEIGECDEGTLKWIENDKILDLQLWEGDRLFWQWILQDKGLFSANFKYENDKLIEHEVVFYEE
jgi:8-oxo-dGTP diphosphatase